MSYTNGLDKPSDYFNTLLYTGDGSASARAFTGVGFQPDLVWLKARNQAYEHNWYDSVRGANKVIGSSFTDAESSSGDLDSFDSDGFTITNSATYLNNASGVTHASWNWLAGGTASSNTDGDITSSVSANTTAGFSIVSYTGSATNPSTVGHGLGTAPAMIIVKNRSTSGRDWVIWHKSLGGASSTADLLLFTDSAKITSSGYWGSSAPNSTTFGVGNTNNNNANGDNHIAYCFAEKKGYSKFGNYTGNGSTDGTFVYTGFKPAWIMGKRTDVSNNWYMFDSTRNTFNVTDKKLRADESSAENVNSAKTIDILSNGFKVRSSDPEFNASGGSYVYMAFAENPFVTSTGIPTTAR